MVDRSTAPLEMFGEPDDTECPHGIPTGMGVECWECRYDQLKIDYDALEQECDELAERLQKLAAEIAEPSIKELDTLHRIRKAVGDTGKMMQDELVDKIQEIVSENATLKKALDGLKQQLTAIGKVANFVLYKGEEAQKLAMEIENIIDPLYCPKCGACGEEGCCSPDRCIELPCLYGEHYLKSYKELEAENVILRKRLEPIEYAWSTKSNYLVEEFIDVMYEAIEKAMELKEG